MEIGVKSFSPYFEIKVTSNITNVQNLMQAHYPISLLTKLILPTLCYQFIFKKLIFHCDVLLYPLAFLRFLHLGLALPNLFASLVPSPKAGPWLSVTLFHWFYTSWEAVWSLIRFFIQNIVLKDCYEVGSLPKRHQSQHLEWHLFCMFLSNLGFLAHIIFECSFTVLFLCFNATVWVPRFRQAGRAS